VQVDRGRRLLRSYRAAGADFVNFHWYESDPEALREVVDSLRSQTGLPAVSNEMGQRTDDPSKWESLACPWRCGSPWTGRRPGAW
jgi:hypothetical protein